MKLNQFDLLLQDIEKLRDATIKACLTTEDDPDFNYWQIMQSAMHIAIQDRIEEIEEKYKQL